MIIFVFGTPLDLGVELRSRRSASRRSISCSNFCNKWHISDLPQKVNFQINVLGNTIPEVKK